MESHAFFVKQVDAECGVPLTATSAKVFDGWTAMSHGGACGDAEKAVLAELAEKCCKIESIEQFSKLNRTVRAVVPFDPPPSPLPPNLTYHARRRPSASAMEFTPSRAPRCPGPTTVGRPAPAIGRAGEKINGFRPHCTLPTRTTVSGGAENRKKV